MSKIIRRYSNRKLYDTQTSQYVNLTEVYQMVREGQDLTVYDMKRLPAQDITAAVLRKALLDRETDLNADLLKAVIKSGDGTLNGFISTTNNK